METSLPVEVSAEESLARFLFSKRDFKRAEGKPRFTAFMPNPSGETSVFRVSSMSEEEKWTLGHTHVAPGRQASLKARADLVAREVFESGLQVVPETARHPRHANMLGWPNTEQEQMLVAMKLERVSSLVFPPN